MRKHQFMCGVLAILFVLTPAFGAGGKETPSGTDSRTTLTVYAYDSFLGDWGAGPVVIPPFEERTGIKVNLVSPGDALEVLNKAISERESPRADIVLGISDHMSAQALASDLFEVYESTALTHVPDFVRFDKTNRLLPFEYGNFAFMIDTEKISLDQAPRSLRDLTEPRFKDKIILIDPRTSSVGLGLLIWSIQIFGEDGYLGWWQDVARNALTIADGWSSAYGLFTEGEAPLVISYSTSPVYHVLNENSTRYRALIFDEGHSATYEGIGILKSSKNKEAARQFVDYLLTDAQEQLAIINSMYPTNEDVELSDVYDWAPKPNKTLSLAPQAIEKNLDRWLTEWTEAVTR
ncbi:thiamine ABC transporter substrate-binding protein [Parasphaerochaeta coccoides]|uniref:ABC transporter, periplasmic binding protein, thiB subfamily n=1 Tax=Parasphaerochaeta coccoides (strain ATCC BAA-1237 / DSM 17374 / SPN1) TaxID=760011 RepID=F4GIN0_PARC1|nr:thiamine ABC transporter substrate-binding protein [Parasphaerochaeta coccoides]AEC02164.1 ABC transporter, periplasmic binding protein, thiB subfamily [Parasphaerochaeta coccoides DSM 17374]